LKKKTRGQKQTKDWVLVLEAIFFRLSTTVKERFSIPQNALSHFWDNCPTFRIYAVPTEVRMGAPTPKGIAQTMGKRRFRSWAIFIGNPQTCSRYSIMANGYAEEL